MMEQRLIDLDNAMDIATLYDWYISSVMPDDEPVWTEKHIEELFSDFYVVPKEAPTIEAEPVKHGKWIDADDEEGIVCSECGTDYCTVFYDRGDFFYCPNCGARNDGE